LYGQYFNVLAFFSEKYAARLAFDIFCTPRKGRVTPNQEDFLKKAESKVEEVNGLQLQSYRWPGDKETVLLLHGWESNSFRWRNLIGFLQKEGYNIIAFDAPAHGKSSGKVFNVPLYTECARQIILEHRPSYLIAHSIGGLAAIYHQFKYKDKKIDKLVSIGAPEGLPLLMDHYEKILKYNQRVVNAIDDHVEDSFGFRIKEFSAPQFVKHIATKGLLIHDKLDRVAPFSASEKAHANWKNSRLITTEGLGHSLHQDEVNVHILDFLKS